MVIVAVLYVILIWLIFSKLKLVRWGWVSGTIAVLIGVFILSVFLALLNYLTPSGRITVASRVVEVTPNVAGETIAIPVKTNTPLKAGDILFRIDPAPFKYKVAQLEAALVAAQQQAQTLRENYKQASSNVEGLTSQVNYHRKRLADIQTLTPTGTATPFREQDTREQLESVSYRDVLAERLPGHQARRRGQARVRQRPWPRARRDHRRNSRRDRAGTDCNLRHAGPDDRDRRYDVISGRDLDSAGRQSRDLASRHVGYGNRVLRERRCRRADRHNPDLDQQLHGLLVANAFTSIRMRR